MEKKFLDYDGLQELVLKIKEYVGDAGKLEFKGVVADVAHLPTLNQQKVGWMYTVTAEGRTTLDFVEGPNLKVAANSEVAAIKVEGTVQTSIWSIDGGTSYVNSGLNPYVPAGTVGSATKLCTGYVATSEDTDLIEGALYVTDDDGATFYHATALADNFAGFVKTEVEAGAAFDALTAKISDFVDVNVYTETITNEGMKWCLIGPVFDVSDKLTFTTTVMPAANQGDVVMYLGETTYKYTEVTPEVGDDPAALGWYHSDDSGETWELATEHEADTSTYIYATKDEEFVQGVVYEYDETDGWKNLNSGDIMTPITNSEIDALFVD